MPVTLTRLKAQDFIKDIVGLTYWYTTAVVVLECGHEFVETKEVDELRTKDAPDAESFAYSYSCPACALKIETTMPFLSREWVALFARLGW